MVIFRESFFREFDTRDYIPIGNVGVIHPFLEKFLEKALPRVYITDIHSRIRIYDNINRTLAVSYSDETSAYEILILLKLWGIYGKDWD